MTTKQWQNRIRLIAVSEIIKQFRKAGIIKEITRRAEEKGHVASGNLINPEKSNSIIPNRDDRFLTRRDKKRAISVRVYKIVQGIPSSLTIKTNISYGVDKKYYFLTQGSPNEKWHPNREGIDNLERWVKQKASRGKSFYLPKRGKKRINKKQTMDPSNPIDVIRVTFAIAKGLEENGIKKSSFANRFEYKNNGVYATLIKAERNINDRLTQLIEQETMVSINKIFSLDF
jgi:hypothetical protein